MYFDKVLFDYRKQRATRANSGIRSVDLNDFIENEKNKKQIYDHLLFYIIKANSDELVKFGVAGTSGKSSSWGRLHQYINAYGKQSDLNTCAGVRLLFLAGTKYNKNVDMVNTHVYKKELACKRFFRETDRDGQAIIKLKGRGYERVFESDIENLFKIVDDRSNKLFDEIETERRTSERLQQSDLDNDDKVIKIISHDTKKSPSKAMTKYRVQWNRSYELTKRDKKGNVSSIEIDTTDEFYKNIITFPGGSDALKVYKVLHSGGLFRD